MRIFRRISLPLLIVFLLASIIRPEQLALAAEKPETIFTPGNVRFEHLAVEDGLPNATVLSVLQDQQGFMWFSTADGVTRYDGYTFETFRHEIGNQDSLSNNNTFALIESRDGLIWVGTDPGGLNVYDPATGKFSHYLHQEDNPNSLINDSIWSLMEAQDGAIWIGTRAGLSRLDRQSGQFTNFAVAPNNPRALAGAVVYRIIQDRSGVIWVGTRNGLQRYEPETQDFTLFKNNPDDPHSISSSNVWAILEDSQGRFWVGTRGGGLNLFDRAAGTFTAYTHVEGDPTSLSDKNIWNIYEDLSGRLWVLTENGGLNLFDPSSKTAVSFQHNPNDPLSLSNNDIFWMTEDRSGVLWITSRYGGVNLCYPALWRFGLYRNIYGNPNTINSNNIYSFLAEPDGVLWVGTFGGGLNRLDRKNSTVTIYKNNPSDAESLSNDKVYNIFRDEKGVLWIATSGGGLNRMDPDTGKFKNYRYSTQSPNVIGSSFLTIIKSAGPGRLWVGTLGYGLDLFNTQTGEMDREFFNKPDDPNSLAEDTVYDLAVEKSGRVWIATARGGLDLLDPASGVFTHHLNDPNNPNSILSNTVHSVYLDEQNGIVWAGTAGGLSGLELATQKWRNYTLRDGLPTDTIVGVLPGSAADLWISTGKGISHFDPAAGTFANYDSRDGLQGDQFTIASAHRGPDGELFFGGSNGVTYFHPQDITPNPYLPPVVFTDFQLFNQSVQAGSSILPHRIEKTDQIILQHDQSVFTLKFAALSYQFSVKNLYQYKMEGFDKDWSPPRAKQEVTYTSLPPGVYTFSVRAANNDGVWNHETAKIVVIKILPPWWETLWFRILAVLAVLLLIFGGVQIRINSVNTQNRELEKRVNERTSQLEDAHQQLSLANDELKQQLAAITALEKEVRELAIRDALTGLYNRRYLSERLQAEYSRADREKHSIAFLLMDVDHFKNVNDTFGHQAGDDALKAVSQIIIDQTRRSDIACRYGGEEFMVVMPGIGAEDALHRAEQFRQKVEEMPIEHDGKAIHVTLSIGVAVYPLHGADQDNILSNADAALYQAKESGRNRVVMFSQEAGA